MRHYRIQFNPVFLLLVILMAVTSIMQYGSVSEWVVRKALILPGILIGLSFHEFAHAEMAYILGDPTAKNLGRATINPKAHFDPFGFIALLFLGFGWGVAVPYNPNNLKNRRSGEILIGIAGVAMNFVIAIIAGIIYVLMYKQGYYAALGSGLGNIVALMVFYIMDINLVLMVFNLIPIPPLDGFGILDSIFTFRPSPVVEFLRRNGFLIMMVLILFNIINLILTPAVNFLMSGILNILSGIIL